MDPSACFQRFLDAFKRGDSEEMRESMRDLREWLRKGGFAPRVAIHAACDEWMQGDRFGEVVGFGQPRDYVNTYSLQTERTVPVRVRLDSGRVRRFHPSNVWVA